MNGDYMASTLGRIKSLKGKASLILRPGTTEKGYLKVNLRKNKKAHSYRVHRLIAKTFLENPESKSEIDHIDGNKTNNRVDNLRWCTHKENMKYYCTTHSISKPVYCLDLDMTYSSAIEASKLTGVSRSSIVKACQGILHSAGGMWWCYEKDKSTKFKK